MLPGLRFLFAAIVLCFSIVVFGLGAAALLKSAHEEFANRPSLRGAPEITFAQPSDDSNPVLALLKVEPAKPEPTAAAAVDALPPADHGDAPAVADTPAPAEPAPEETTRVAALTTATREPAEPPKVEVPVVSPPAPQDASRAEDEPSSTASIAPPKPAPSAREADHVEMETKAPPEASGNSLGEGNIIVEQPADTTGSIQPAAPSRSEPDLIAAKLASLGDAPQATVAETPETRAGNDTESATDRRALKRQQRARRAKERRRLAAARRARMEQSAPAQPQDPFASPFAPQPQGQPSPAQFRPIQPAQSQ